MGVCGRHALVMVCKTNGIWFGSVVVWEFSVGIGREGGKEEGREGDERGEEEGEEGNMQNKSEKNSEITKKFLKKNFFYLIFK
jgi:hypothetical protein